MAFQVDAFQLDAFQWAVTNNQRSGVVRLWLAKLTAELNGIPWDEDATPEVMRKAAPKKVIEKVVETADGGALVGNKPARVVFKKAPVLKKEPTAEERIASHPHVAMLPTPTETASYLLEKIGAGGKQMLWDAETVLNTLKLAVEEDQEEEDMLEAVARMLL